MQETPLICPAAPRIGHRHSIAQGHPDKIRPTVIGDYNRSGWRRLFGATDIPFELSAGNRGDVYSRLHEATDLNKARRSLSEAVHLLERNSPVPVSACVSLGSVEKADRNHITIGRAR